MFDLRPRDALNGRGQQSIFLVMSEVEQKASLAD